MEFIVDIPGITCYNKAVGYQDTAAPAVSAPPPGLA